MFALASLFALVTLSVTLSVEEESEDEGIEEGANDERPSGEGEVVQSCETALGPGECSAPASSDPSEWSAHVVFSSDSVEVTLEKAGQRIHRQLVFSEADGLDQRRVAAGLLVAAMTASARLAEVPQEKPQPVVASAPLPPPTSSQPQEDVVESRQDPRSHFSIDLGLSSAPVLDWDTWGLGAQLRGTWWSAHESRLSPWGVTASLSGLHSLGTAARAGQLEGSLGVAVSLLGPQGLWSLELHGEGLLNATRVFAIPETEGSEGAVRGGAQWGAVIALGRSTVAPFLGVDARWLAPEMEIQREGATYIQVAPFSVALHCGVRFQHLEIN